MQDGLAISSIFGILVSTLLTLVWSRSGAPRAKRSQAGRRAASPSRC